MSLKKVAIVGMLLSVAGVAAAEGDYYAQFNLGASSSINSSVEYKVNGGEPYQATGNAGSSALFGLEGGARINENLRAGLALDFRPGYTSRMKDGNTEFAEMKLKSTSLMANMYYDFTDMGSFMPYVTLGLGMAQNEMKADGINGFTGSIASKKTTGFAYKLGLGTRYAMTKDFDLDVRYQYVDLGKAKFGNTITSGGQSANVETTKSWKLRAHEFLIGVAYKF
jgi:opacity protein-like surface antigen